MTIADLNLGSSRRSDVELNDAAADEEWPPYNWPVEPIRAAKPTAIELLKLRSLIVFGAVSVIVVLAWLLSPDRVGDLLPYFGLTLAVLLRATCRLFEWYNYWTIKIAPVIQPRPDWTVDVMTTACPGEPDGMIVRTLKAMTQITYPHTNYLCDEGNDPYLRRVCEELGVIHVTRTHKSHAKAGNINNALKSATGEIVVVLDPDHEPAPYFLDRILGQFENPAVGFVQSVQAYRNQNESFIAKGAAEQSYHFYGPQMMGMNGHGTTQAIGANCVFRRAALDSIGGHAPGLAEDMHTSMRMYSKGWKSVYVPEILTRGLVPATLPAFYRQQIKWSCGVFDLLFQEYPKLCGGFTLRQKIHFLLCPLFFLRGLIGLLEMLVPLACLSFGFIAWRATLPQIAFWFVPVLAFSALIHLRVQRWVMEPSERGLHVAGGLLAIATWWVYLAGFVCALFRIRVPYIPTPKEGDATNAGGVILPNLLAAAVLTTAAGYGVYLDSSPYAIFMAGIAMASAIALVGVSVAAQQLTIQRIGRRLRRLTTIFQPVRCVLRWIDAAHVAIMNQLREGTVLPSLLFLALIAAYLPIFPKPSSGGNESQFALDDHRDPGGFYTGIELGALADGDLAARAARLQKQLNFKFRIVAVDQQWDTAKEIPIESLKQLRRSGAMPFINWLPTQEHVDSVNGQPLSGMPILRAIRFGKYDAYLNEYAQKIRQFGEPVFISFAPQQDNPKMPWSQTQDGGNSAIDFAEAWKHIAVIFREQGASNVAWVWTPSRADAIESESPLELEYVNWIGLPASSNQSPGNQSALSFSQQYQPFRSKISKWHLPVMIDALSATCDEKGAQWLQAAMTDITAAYPEIKGIMLSSTPASAPLVELPRSEATPASDLVLPSSQWTLTLKEVLQGKPFSDGAARAGNAGSTLWFDQHPAPVPSRCIKGSPGNFSLMVDGAPFYIKGVVYNAGHDWRDGEVPLTRRELDHDFAAIHAMGGNTIRRYGSNFSDRNIFNSAADNQLKVMYGFWLPQDANYLTDQAKLQELQDQIEKTVRTYRKHPGLLGWSLGNEVWGLLKHKYAQPYLTEVRHAEVLYVEKLARRIKELDPNHPVFCAQESFDVSGAVADYATGAPSLDAICVNSYYEQEIAHLDQAVTHVDSSRPYVVSEFGPDGYWNDKYNHRDPQNGLLEATGMMKGWLYADRWREYIERNKGRDVGGIAYCWSDRFEGTATWFGMTDSEGRTKPAVAALTSAWNNPDTDLYGQFSYDGPRILDVSYPTEPQRGKIPFTVSGKIQTCNGDKTAFIWTVTGPDFTSDGVTIEPIGNGQSATITLPDRPGWYRVQLKVTNRDGLDELSVPVKVAAVASSVAIR